MTGLFPVEYGEQVKMSEKLEGQKREGFSPYDRDEDRKIRKNKLKQVLYQLLVEETGHTLPWGNLTGIRPTKIAMGLIESGMSNAQAAQYMRDTYFTSREKTALAIAIANRRKPFYRILIMKRDTVCMWAFPFVPVSVCTAPSVLLL